MTKKKLIVSRLEPCNHIEPPVNRFRIIGDSKIVEYSEKLYFEFFLPFCSTFSLISNYELIKSTKHRRI